MTSSSPDFDLLIAKYPPLQSYAKNGKLDLSLLEAVYVFTEACLKEYHSLDVNLNRNFLCPRLPNRLEYLTWINNILRETRSSQSKHRPKIFDIGTGASCIYPLLGASFYDFSFEASECNPESIRLAQLVLSQNPAIAKKVRLIRVEKSESFFNKCNGPFDFTMCNPPFYSSQEQMRASKEFKSHQPNTTSLAAAESELITPGGEERFTSDLVRESMKVPDLSQWFSTMVGHRSTLIQLIALLHENNIGNYAVHVLSRGQTTRWFLAWSFMAHRPRMSLSNIPFDKEIKNPSRTERVCKFQSLPTFRSKLLRLLKSLQEIELSISEKNIEVKTKLDCWSRAYRRQKMKAPNSIQFGDVEEIYSIDFQSDTCAIIYWRYGTVSRTFESFVSKIYRECI